MRPLLLNVTFFVAAGFTLLLAARLLLPPQPGPGTLGDLVSRLLRDRRLAVLLLAGAFVNLSLRLTAGYINPRDFLQDTVAAHQLLAGKTLYPPDLQQLATAETAAPFLGEAALRKVPLLNGEFRNLGQNVTQNAHPPLVALLVASPVALLGTRGSFLAAWIVSSLLLYVSFRFVILELFGTVALPQQLTLMAAVFGWYPVVSTLRSGQSAIILFALCTASWALLRRKRFWAAGVPIGIAASIHAFPGLLLVYFLFRVPKSFGGAVATLVGLNGLAALVAGPGSYLEWLTTAGAVSRSYLSYRANYSIAGAIACLSRSLDLAWAGSVLTACVIGAAALASAIWTLRRRKIALSTEAGDLEFAACVVLMLLASPVCWDRYFPILLLPLSIGLRYQGWNGRIALVFATAIALISIPGDSLDVIFGALIATVGVIPAWAVTSLPIAFLVAMLVLLGRTPAARPPASG